MKTKLIILLIACVVVLTILTIDIFQNNKLKRISNKIELDISKCNIDNEEDTHGGFLGDGHYFIQINCSHAFLEELSSNWKELPLSTELQKATSLKMCENNGCKDIYERYSIPNIENGYYYFIDRHNESRDKYDDTNLNNRSSLNYTVALLDIDTNIIYFYELDT